MMEPNHNIEGDAVDAAFDEDAAEIFPNAEHDEDEEEEGGDDDDDDEDDEQEEDVVVDPVESKRIFDKVAAIIQQRDNLPVRTRTNMIRFAQQFLDNVRHDIHDMITDTCWPDYAGLDSERDTEAEVSTALGFFPQTLSESGPGIDQYPIQCITGFLHDGVNYICNVQAVSFVHLFASFAIEHNLFQADQRGGLLIEGEYVDTILSNLVASSNGSPTTDDNDDNFDRHVDTTFLASLVRLRQSGLFKKEDIQRYGLLHELCGQAEYFAEQRFRYLLEMDCWSLMHHDIYGHLPLHYVGKWWSSIELDPIELFRHVFDTGMRYFPNKIGFSLLFRKNNNGKTPFELACGKNCRRRNEVMEAVETTLAQFSSHSSTTPLNIRDALILTAIDERIHLNGLYFLMRRQPDTMLGMLHLHQELTPSFTFSNTSNSQHASNSSSFGSTPVDPFKSIPAPGPTFASTPSSQVTFGSFKFSNTSNSQHAANNSSFGSIPVDPFKSIPAPGPTFGLTPSSQVTFGSTSAPAARTPSFGFVPFGTSAGNTQTSNAFGSTTGPAPAPVFGNPATVSAPGIQQQLFGNGFGSTPVASAQPFGNNDSSGFNTVTTFGTTPAAPFGSTMQASTTNCFDSAITQPSNSIVFGGGFGSTTPNAQPIDSSMSNGAPFTAQAQTGSFSLGTRGRSTGRVRIVKARRPK